MAAPKDRLTRWEQWSQIAVNVGLLIAGLVAIVQYFDIRHDRRVERVLKFAERFEQEPLLDAQQKLLETFRNQARTAAQLNNAKVDRATALEEEEAFVRFLHVDAYGTGLDDQIDLIVRFMDGVDNCLREDLCDREVTRGYFTPEAKRIAHNLRYYIKDVRDNRAPDYGAGLLRIAELTR